MLSRRLLRRFRRHATRRGSICLLQEDGQRLRKEQDDMTSAIAYVLVPAAQT
jgi:hypothetical protein